jgi:hypothetical protein
MLGSRVNFRCEIIQRTDIDEGSEIQHFDSYWRGLLQGRRMPSPEKIDPINIPARVLPWIFLMDVIEECSGYDYRYRLCGTGNVGLFGRDPTGKLATKFFDEIELHIILTMNGDVVVNRAPSFTNALLPHPTLDYFSIQRGLFPLSRDDQTVDRLIGIAVPSVNAQRLPPNRFDQPD